VTQVGSKEYPGGFIAFYPALYEKLAERPDYAQRFLEGLYFFGRRRGWSCPAVLHGRVKV
jgi:hypothetical protein